RCRPDAFYAAVEVLDNPSLEGSCLLIGGSSTRAVVATASYEARRFGIHSAMPMNKALRLCPHAKILQPRMERYSEVSANVMEILKRFSSSVQQLSIDEAFLDMSGTKRLFGIPRQAGMLLKNTVKQETGLNISVGIGPSHFIAKMASDYDKPDGLCRVSKGKELAFIDAVGLKKLWGVGKVTQALLAKHHITSTVELRSYSEKSLRSLFGQSMGNYLYLASRGIDPGIFKEQSKTHSISTEKTFEDDVSSLAILEQTLLVMAHEVMFRALDEKQVGRTIGLKIRLADFTTYTLQTTPSSTIYSAEQIYHFGKTLLLQKWKEGTFIRLIGLGLYQLYDGQQPLQQELFEDPYKKKRALEEVALRLHKQGKQLIKATSLEVHKEEKPD
ncbi:MAG: DNA polymerase IV, partial [Spirochaetia bacterium]|nr:DNA polymerase IV [Spirochaetia bacterium]